MIHGKVSRIVLVLLLAPIGCADRQNSPPTTPQESAPTVEEMPPPPSLRPYDQFIAQVWRTPLGQDFSTYLFSDAMPQEMEAITEEFTEKLFSDKRHAITLISLLQLMSEDLYARGKLTDDANSRLSLLQGRVSLYRIELGLIPYQKVALHSFGILTSAATLELYRTKSLHNFNPKRFLGTFFNGFGVYSVIFFIWYDWSKTPAGSVVQIHNESFEFDRALQRAWAYGAGSSRTSTL